MVCIVCMLCKSIDDDHAVICTKLHFGEPIAFRKLCVCVSVCVCVCVCVCVLQLLQCSLMLCGCVVSELMNVINI